MQYRRLGRTGLEVSLICLGTMTWGQQNTEAEGFAQMDYAVDQGVNFFDTAELYAVPPQADTYGATERIIGNWFAARGGRDKIVLASKVAGKGLPWIRGGQGGIDGANIRAALEDSLKRLRTDYIDLYQLHWPNRGGYQFGNHWHFDPSGIDRNAVFDNFLDVLRTLDDLIRAGKIRHIGLSNESAWGTMHYLRLAAEHNLPRMASIQNEYSLLYRLFEPDMAEIAIHEQVGLLAYSPLATGILSGKYLNGNVPAGSRKSLSNQRSTHRYTPQADAATCAYGEVAAKHGLDVCQMALAFVNSRPFLTANIIGATSMEQLKTDIGSVHVSLGDEVLKDIDAVRRLYPVPY